MYLPHLIINDGSDLDFLILTKQKFKSSGMFHNHNSTLGWGLDFWEK